MGEPKKPSFINHEKYVSGLRKLFLYFEASPETQTAVSSAILVKNAIVLLNGSYGTGKTQLVNLIKKLFFSLPDGQFDYDYETCHQDLTATDVLYHLDLAELQRGREIVYPKKMVTARLKFLNEIQRANPTLYNALLPLLSERTITYRDMAFTSPDFLLLMDQNPQDAASSEIPRAFFDRIDFMIDFPAVDFQSSVKLFKKRDLEDGVVWDTLEKLVGEPVLRSDEIAEIWDDVLRVRINDRNLYLANFLLYSFSECVKTDRSLTLKVFNLDCNSCKYKGEICSHLIEVPGHRSLISTLKMAQARAWLSKRDEILFEDLIFSLPFAFSHRINVKRDELLLFENTFIWLKNRAINELLSVKFDVWNKALEYHQSGDTEKIDELAKENPVISKLLN